MTRDTALAAVEAELTRRGVEWRRDPLTGYVRAGSASIMPYQRDWLVRTNAPGGGWVDGIRVRRHVGGLRDRTYLVRKGDRLNVAGIVDAATESGDDR